jgi:oligosaccharide repeat unit polymerase
MIENQLASIAFALSVTCLSYFEIKRFNNLITPFTVSAIPLAFIGILVNFIFIYIEIKPVTTRVSFFLFSCLFIIWVVGLFFGYKFKKKTIINQYSVFSNLNNFTPFLCLLAIIISSLTFLRMYSIIQLNGGWLYLGTEEFEKEMTRGIVAHLVVFGMAIFVLLFLALKNSKHKLKIYFTLIILGISVFLLMVKYTLLWLIMVSFFIDNINKPIKIQTKRIVRIVLILFLIFIMYWIFLSFFWQTFSFTNKNIWIFFYKTFLAYLITGPIVLDFWMDYPSIKPSWTILLVFINFLSFSIGIPLQERASVLNTMGFKDVGYAVYSNIGTSFGSYYLIGGLEFTYLFIMIISLITYYFYTKSFTSTNPLVIFLSWFLLAINALSFFSQYFSLLTTYEFPIFFSIIVYSLRFINKYKNIK